MSENKQPEDCPDYIPMWLAIERFKIWSERRQYSNAFWDAILKTAGRHGFDPLDDSNDPPEGFKAPKP